MDKSWKRRNKAILSMMNDASGGGGGSSELALTGCLREVQSCAPRGTWGDDVSSRWPAARTVTTRVHLWQRREAEVALARRALLLGFLKTDRQCLLPSPHTQICLHTRVHTRVHIAHRTMPKETVPHQQN